MWRSGKRQRVSEREREREREKGWRASDLREICSSDPRERCNMSPSAGMSDMARASKEKVVFWFRE